MPAGEKTKGDRQRAGRRIGDRRGWDDEQEIAGGQDDKQEIAGGRDDEQEIAGRRDDEEDIAGGQDVKQEIAGGRDNKDEIAGAIPQQIGRYSNMICLGIPAVAVLRSTERDRIEDPHRVLRSLNEEQTGVPAGGRGKRVWRGGVRLILPLSRVRPKTSTLLSHTNRRQVNLK